MVSFETRAKKRLDKELERFSNGEDGVFTIDVQAKDVWVVSFTCESNSIYAGETYRIYFRFTADYPLVSPEVKFLLPAPQHPHIYTNGHICLNILYEDWTPALTVKSVCLSLLSMLSSCATRAIPSDNAMYVARTPPSANPKNTRFMYDDATV